MAAADADGRVTLELMEHTLSSSSESRSQENIERILPIFRTRTPLLYNLSTDILVDIAKNASLRKVKRDHVIVWQGQEGKHFGIIIKGSASIHARKDLPREPQQDSVPIPRGNKERSALVGPDLGGLSAGSSFGEMVMTSDRQSRYSSTIIAEELSQVLLIDKELYLRSFGVNNLEWQRKMQFVNQSPLFKTLTPAIKNLLMESLKLLEIQFGNRFVKQGNVCNSLYFICQGWGKVIAEVRTSMIQYEAMIASKKVKDKSSGRRTACSERVGHSCKKLDPSRPLSVIERRRHRKEYGYVAIETLFRQRETHVTTIGPNDIIGDIEIFLDLPTYCATVECLENLQVYELSKYNFFQIITPRCAQTCNILQRGVQTKLRFRSQRLKDIPLYSLLYERSLMSLKDRRKIQGISASPFQIIKTRNAASLWTKNALGPNKLGKITGVLMKQATTTASAETADDSKETPSSIPGKSYEKQPEKEGPKQYTVEEFRVLKKKMQAQGKSASLSSWD